MLYAANCGHPLQHLFVNEPNSESVIVEGYDIMSAWPIVEGTNVSFSCSPDFALSGPHASTCMENGLWIPNPRDVNCRRKGTTMYSATKQESKTFYFPNF